MIRRWFIGLFLVLATVGLAAQATHIQSSGTLPSSCTVGNIYIKTGTSAGFYVCLATNTWTGPLSTGGASGNTTSTGAAGSEPGSPASGDVYLPNNGFLVERSTGSVWVPWGPLFPFTAPVNGDFSWVNQGGASVDTTYGGIHLSAPTDGGAANVRARVKSAPATPYTITAAFLPMLVQTNFHSAGLLFRKLAATGSSTRSNFASKATGES